MCPTQIADADELDVGDDRAVRGVDVDVIIEMDLDDENGWVS